MDYLERLDNSLNTLEKEADKIAAIPQLIREIGTVADALSKENRELNDTARTLQIWREDIDRSFREVSGRQQDELRQLETIGQRLDSHAKNLADKEEALKSAVNETQELISTLQDVTEKEFQNVKKHQAELQDGIYEKFREQEEQITETKALLTSNQKTIRILLIITMIFAVISCIVSGYGLFR